jgi:hypothetical protein
MLSGNEYRQTSKEEHECKSKISKGKTQMNIGNERCLRYRRRRGQGFRRISSVKTDTEDWLIDEPCKNAKRKS